MSERQSVPHPRASGIALHRRMYLVLRDRIVRGDWSAGSALPTEEQLGEQFGVSRITVRRALSDLQAQGLIDRRQGLGTFVSAGVPARATRPTLSFVDGLRKYAEATDVRVIEVTRGPAPAELATLLGLEPGERALRAVRSRSRDGVAVMLTEAWVPARLARGINASALGRRALYQILLAQGVRFGRIVQEFGAVAADPPQAALLGTEIGAPLLRLVRLIHDVDGRPVQHLTVLLPAERGAVMMAIDAAQIDTLSTGYIVHPH
ncbi:MAG: GntR family transcriptional regulator [Burkholderiaceae bacterium]